MNIIDMVRDLVDYLADGNPWLLLYAVAVLGLLIMAQALLTSAAGFSNRNQVLMALEIVGLSVLAYVFLEDFPVLVWGVPIGLILGTGVGYWQWPSVFALSASRNV